MIITSAPFYCTPLRRLFQTLCGGGGGWRLFCGARVVFRHYPTSQSIHAGNPLRHTSRVGGQDNPADNPNT